MNIVILDGHTTNPGDVSWQPLEDIGPCRIYPRTPPDQVVKRAGGAEILITNKVPVDREIIRQLPALKYIGVLATGYNVVDLPAAREREIIVTNVPGYCTDSVVQLVFGLIFELTRRVGYHAGTVRKGRWTRSRDFCYWDFPQIELKDKVMGIFGCGTIGGMVARAAAVFGMKVLAYDVCPPQLKDLPVRRVEINTLLAESDFLSLHAPLTGETRGIINACTLARMKRSAFLINTSRGPVVNEPDLADALNRGLIAGAGLDVLSSEPPGADNPLLRAKNCLITPHIAWASQEARQRLIHQAARNITAFLQKRPVNVVN